MWKGMATRTHFSQAEPRHTILPAIAPQQPGLDVVVEHANANVRACVISQHVAISCRALPRAARGVLVAGGWAHRIFDEPNGPTQ
jgi:hypothetical protein